MLLLVVPLVAFARLGESITDCDARYGGGKPGTMSAEDRIKPLVSGPETTNLTYTFKGVTVRVGFRKSAVVRMDLTKIGSAKFTESEIAEILEGNRGAKSWYQINPQRAMGLIAGSSAFSKSETDVKAWERRDETMAILYNRGRSMRIVLHDDENKPNPAPVAPVKPGVEPVKPSGSSGATTF